MGHLKSFPKEAPKAAACFFEGLKTFKAEKAGFFLKKQNKKLAQNPHKTQTLNPKP